MNLRETLAVDYLSPPAHSFWRWSEAGDAIEWADGRTIAFRAEVEHVLARLAPHGLPPFTAVVLLLAACRDAWGRTSDGRGILHGLMRYANEFAEATNPLSALTSVVASLDAVHALPAELRTPLDAKSILAEVAFDAAPHRGTRSPAPRHARRSGRNHAGDAGRRCAGI